MAQAPMPHTCGWLTVSEGPFAPGCLVFGCWTGGRSGRPGRRDGVKGGDEAVTEIIWARSAGGVGGKASTPALQRRRDREHAAKALSHEVYGPLGRCVRQRSLDVLSNKSRQLLESACVLWAHLQAAHFKRRRQLRPVAAAGDAAAVYVGQAEQEGTC
eukprot:365797-Chlamydomonas_euryale.AAC.1